MGKLEIDFFGSGALLELLSREELLDWFGNCLLSLSTFDDVHSVPDTSSFTCSCSFDAISWLSISDRKCSSSSSNGALDPRLMLERSFGLCPNAPKNGIF